MSTPAPMPSRPDETPEHFFREGYALLRDALDPGQLAMLREESELAIAWQEQAMREGRKGVETLNRLGSRYFVPRRSVERERLRALILGEPMAERLQPFLGPDAYLFIDVFVHKAASSPSAFGWHQDHGYVAHFGFGHAAPNVTVWAPLEDVTEANGALWVLPFTEGGVAAPVPHRLDPATDDCVVDIEARGRCIEMAAGGLLLMSGVLLHRSGPNTTAYPRPAYQWQYGPAPVLHDGRPISLAAPFLRDARWVAGSLGG